MVAKKVVKKKIKKQTQKQKQKQTQKQSVNVNVKIDQSKKGSSYKPRTIVQRVGPQIVMTSAGTYSFPQRGLESNSNNQYNQLASIMEKIVENERYKASRGDALDVVRERRLDRFEPNVARNGLASVKTNNDIETMSILTRDEEEPEEEPVAEEEEEPVAEEEEEPVAEEEEEPEPEEEEEEEEEVIVPEEEEDNQIVVPQGIDPNLSIFDADTLVEEKENPMRIKAKADKYASMVEEEERRKNKYSYPTNVPFDAFDKYFNTETGRWNLSRNVRKQKGGFRMKQSSDAHYKKNV